MTHFIEHPQIFYSFLLSHTQIRDYTLTAKVKNNRFTKLAMYATSHGKRFMNNSRDYILDTAVTLFLQKSFREVTMNDIVTASDMSKGAFYYYFSSKEKVFDEVIKHFFLDSRKDDYTKLFQESLWAFCQDYVGMVIERVLIYSEKTGDTETFTGQSSDAHRGYDKNVSGI